MNLLIASLPRTESAFEGFKIVYFNWPRTTQLIETFERNIENIFNSVGLNESITNLILCNDFVDIFGQTFINYEITEVKDKFYCITLSLITVLLLCLALSSDESYSRIISASRTEFTIYFASYMWHFQTTDNSDLTSTPDFCKVIG